MKTAWAYLTKNLSDTALLKLEKNDFMTKLIVKSMEEYANAKVVDAIIKLNKKTEDGRN